MIRKDSRKVYNLAVVKKGNRFDIVRYNNGFDNEPSIILRDVTKEEINSKFNRAIQLIASTMKEFGVFLRPSDRNKLVELVLIIEDSGVNISDIKIQDNGIIYFKVNGEDDASVRKNIESILRENNFEYETNTVTVTRGDAIIDDKEDTKKEEPVEEKKSQLSLDEKELVEFETLNKYAELQNNPELKERYAYLKNKFGYIQHSPSLDESVPEPLSLVEPKVNPVETYLNKLTTKYDSANDLIKSLLDFGIKVEDIKEFFTKNPESLVTYIK